MDVSKEINFDIGSCKHQCHKPVSHDKLQQPTNALRYLIESYIDRRFLKHKGKNVPREVSVSIINLNAGFKLRLSTLASYLLQYKKTLWQLKIQESAIGKTDPIRC